MPNTNYRQRFFIQDSPVRGDVVRLTDAYCTVIGQKDYPVALKALLGELLVSASLLISTLKIDGKLSIQLQHPDPDAPFRFAMAECDTSGAVRALAGFKNLSDDDHAIWQNARTASDAFKLLGKGVLFISIHPQQGESYQGIVEKVSDDLGECLAHYQKQSVQIPTIIKIATDESGVGGLLIQLLPQSDDDKENDPDLWDRMSVLANTIKADELTTLPADEILYRLYHEENVVLPEKTALHFACTCSLQKSEGAIVQLGLDEALQVVDAHGGTLTLDCGFCGKEYRFDKDSIEQLFA
ncbi:MAG: Hsp33 family molecular chaperone HslO [Moraxella sp.]|nr:Hsp33 family molecular chaperone HslO [Moraxella sp.]